MSRLITRFQGDLDFCSSFYAGHPFEFKGKLCQTREHAYQAEKPPADAYYQGPFGPAPELWSDYILKAASPGKAKRLGQICPQKPTWQEDRLTVMEAVLRCQYATYESLRKRLISTGKLQLIEGNTWHDTFWGVCIGCVRRGQHEPEGENNLGKLHMKLRREFQREFIASVRKDRMFNPDGANHV